MDDKMSLFDKLKHKKEKQETHAFSNSANSKEMAYGFEYGHRTVFIGEHKYEPLSDYGKRLMASCLLWRHNEAGELELRPADGKEKDVARFYVVQSILLKYANPPLKTQKTEEGKKKLDEWKRLFALTDEDIKDAEGDIIKNLKLINGEDYICLDTLE
jgi:hypothetical protein